ncbi:MAG: hypothetical protein IPF47_01555 [Gemmatimonadetes bacterium]|nr:hypothetical protein [Gemmatimonadota bacterium]
MAAPTPAFARRKCSRHLKLASALRVAARSADASKEAIAALCKSTERLLRGFAGLREEIDGLAEPSTPEGEVSR